MGDSFLSLIKKAKAIPGHDEFFKPLNWHIQSSMADLYQERNLLKKMYGVGHVATLGPPPPAPEVLVNKVNDLFAEQMKAMKEYRHESYDDEYRFVYGKWNSYQARSLNPKKVNAPEAKEQCHPLFSDTELMEVLANFKQGVDAVPSAAMYFLWRNVLNNIKVRHPDPKATIRVSVERPTVWNRAARGDFHLGVNDTRSDGNAAMSSGFRMPWQCTVWPGKRAAELFFVAAWATYLSHEATEMVHFNDKLKEKSPQSKAYPDWTRVFNVHSAYDYDKGETEADEHAEYHWQQMEACMHEYASWRGKTRTEPAGQVVLQSILGPDAAREVWEAGINQGVKDLAELEGQIRDIIAKHPYIKAPPVAPDRYW